MHHIKLFLATTTAISASGYSLFELLIKGSTGLFGLGAAALGFAAGVWAYRTAKRNHANADLQRQVLEKQLSKL